MNSIAIERRTPLDAKVRLAGASRVFVLCCFAGWLFLVGSHHEPWFDEAQAWLLARDNGLWDLLAHRVRYEGTPGLWHAIVWLAIRAGLPYAWFFVLPGAFAVAGAAVILWRAPFPAPLRVALLTSYYYGYQFSVVARSYCLDLLLVPLAAVFFADRVERPIRYAVVIGLVANANTHGLLVGGVLGLELAWQMIRNRRLDRGSAIGGLAIAAGLGLFAVFCTWQPSDNGFVRPGFADNRIVMAAVYTINAFVDHIAVWNSSPSAKYDTFFSVILTFVLQIPVVALVRAGKNKAMASGVIGVLLLFAICVYASLWHSGILFLFWMFVLWVEWGNPLSVSARRQLVAALAVILSLQAIQTVRTGWWDIGNVYAPGQQTAQALSTWRATHPHGRIFGYGDYVFTVQPWLDGNVFDNYHDGDPRVSYVRWDRHEPWMAGGWQAQTHLNFWHQVLAGRPDLIVASPLNRARVGDTAADLAAQACRAGYAVRSIFPGTMVWRGRPAGDQSLYLFERQTIGPCARN